MANRVSHDSGRSVSTISLLVAAAIAGALAGWRVPGRVRTVAAPTVAPVATTGPVAHPAITTDVRAPSIPSQSRRHVENPVCGLDPEAPDDEGSSASPAPSAALRSRTLAALEARMMASPDQAIQAAGLLIGARTGPDDNGQRIERLARLATATRDARIHAIAAEGCRAVPHDAPSACHLLEPAQWTQLDSNNAVPWLTLAETSRARGDANAEDDAMYHAAHARHSDLRPVLLPALVEQALTDTPPRSLLRTLSLAAGWEVQAGWSFSATTQAMHYCMADDRVLIDPDRTRTCDLLARVLAESGSSSIDLATAQSIGARLGWPAERLDALTSQAEASGAVARRRNVAMDMSCAGVAAAEASLQSAMREMAADARR